ncbi:MAG: PAS domain S-box protein [Isosphaeraceae bacterium]
MTRPTNQSGTDGYETTPHDSRNLFRLIVESARDFAIFSTDLERRIITWNPGAERLTGYPESEILGRRCDIIYVPEDRDKDVPWLEADKALAEGRAEDDRWHLRRNGVRFWGSGLMMPLRDEFGRPQGLVKILRDMTERAEAESRLTTTMRDLEESEERHRLLVSEVKGHGIFMLDPTGHVMTWNLGAERLKGYSREEVLGLHISRFFTDEDRARGMPEEELNTAVRDGRSEGEGWRVRKDGSLFWGNEIMTALRYPDGRLRGFAKIVRDLSERKQAEDELRQARDELEIRVQERTAELSRALESLSLVGDDRRRTERARVELLRRVVTIQEDERKRISRELHDEMGQHIAALSLELKLLQETLPTEAGARRRLELLQERTSRIGHEVHRLALELRPTSLDDLGLQTTLENLLEEWSERTRIAVEFHCGLGKERLPSPIETTLYRIVQEALTNILKHGKASQASVVLERPDDEIHLIIEDNGQGFDPGNLTDFASGDGRIGLLGIKERVAMVGGTLTIESSPGSAVTTVFVRVPLSRDGDSSHA